MAKGYPRPWARSKTQDRDRDPNAEAWSLSALSSAPSPPPSLPSWPEKLPHKYRARR